MPSLAIDLTYGLKKEADIITTLSTFFEKDLKKTDHFCKWDFEDEERNLTIELKSRRNTMMAYPTTLIPIHKITNETQNLYFVFHFIDKLAYIKYEKDTFDTFKTCYITARGRDRGADHYLIPISLLKSIE